MAPAQRGACGVATARDSLSDQLRRADLVLCASERQRLLYLGHLGALGRVSPPPPTRATQSCGACSALAPFGLPTEPPAAGLAPCAACTPSVDADSRVLLWGGGGLRLVRPAHPHRGGCAGEEDGAGHPTGYFWVRATRRSTRWASCAAPSTSATEAGGWRGREVIFNDTWVPYDERGAYLLEADVGVSTHHVHVETTFAFRTRILDYLWAGLPMVVTEGDGFADLVHDEGLGIVVPAHDADALAEALTTVLTDTAAAERYRANVARVREQYTWPVVLEPLVRYVDAPHHAADYVAGRASMGVGSSRARRTVGPGHSARMAWHHLRHSGVRGVAERVRARFRFRQ